MPHLKMSVTVPEDILNEIKKIAGSRGTKVSHMVTEALRDKIMKIKEDAFVSQINKILEDPEVIKDQRKMADDIANTMNIEELPW
jgi:metal-responsive CopG/Arc/MetJ family transcriptional regulator